MPLRQSTHIQYEAGLAVAGLRVSVETLAALLTELVAIDIGLQKRCDASGIVGGQRAWLAVQQVYERVYSHLVEDAERPDVQHRPRHPRTVNFLRFGNLARGQQQRVLNQR
jgi:hypothetical protein